MKATLRCGTLAAAALSILATHAGADTWSVHMTVDNQFDAYSGTASAVSTLQGTGNNWSTVYPLTMSGMAASDYFYVVTASDYRGAQGFLGDFSNLTTGQTFNTGSQPWRVFPVGAYLQQIDSSWPSSWPANVMPSQTQVNQAMAFAAANPSVWIHPKKFPNWDNRVSGNITSWGYRPGIDPAAKWIWNSVTGGNPFDYGYNHDEFLIFRVPGAQAPAPAGLSAVGLAALACARRRRV